MYPNINTTIKTSKRTPSIIPIKVSWDILDELIISPSLKSNIDVIVVLVKTVSVLFFVKATNSVKLELAFELDTTIELDAIKLISEASEL